MDLAGAAIILGGYVLLPVTSGQMVSYVLGKVAEEPIGQKLDKRTLDTGFIIGKCENLLILTFMLMGQATAIALVFAAKAIVRREDISKNSLFFLAGTMVNVTYSVAMGALVKALLSAAGPCGP